MKRKLSTSTGKRLLPSVLQLDPIPTPEEFKKKYSELDFVTYAYAKPFDIVISSCDIEFLAHREILAANSTVIRDILEGDQTCDVLQLHTAPASVMELFQHMIYARWDKRKITLDDWLRKASAKDILAVMDFEKKYDITLLRRVFDKFITVFGGDTGIFEAEQAEQYTEERCSFFLKLNTKLKIRHDYKREYEKLQKFLRSRGIKFPIEVLRKKFSEGAIRQMVEYAADYYRRKSKLFTNSDLKLRMEELNLGHVFDEILEKVGHSVWDELLGT